MIRPKIKRMAQSRTLLTRRVHRDCWDERLWDGWHCHELCPGQGEESMPQFRSESYFKHILTSPGFLEWRTAFGGAALDAWPNHLLLRGTPVIETLLLLNCCIFGIKLNWWITIVDFSCRGFTYHILLSFSDMMKVWKDQARPRRQRGWPKLEFISSKVLPCKY